MATARVLVSVVLALAASAALGQGPGSRLLIGSPPTRPALAPQAEHKPERKPLDASACDRLRGAARGRCLLETREVATGETSAGPASVGAGSGAASGAAAAAGGSAR